MDKRTEIEEHISYYAKQNNLYGVDVLRNQLRNDKYWGDVAYLFADARDMYTPVLCYDVHNERYLNVCLEDLAEANAKYRHYIGYQFDLLESFCFGFLYEVDGWKKEDATEIRVTVFHVDSSKVDTRFCSHTELMNFIADCNDSFFSTTGRSIEDYQQLRTEDVFADLIGIYSPFELGMFDGGYSLDGWIRENSQYSNIDFDVYSVINVFNP